MYKLPKRDDNIYKEIEKFQDYELTECIAYEMAIRTPLVKEYLELKKSIKNKILELYKLEEKILNECWLHHKDIYLEHNKKYNIANEMPAHTNNKTVLASITDSDGNEILVIDNNELSRQSYKTTSRPLLSIPKEHKNNISVQINFNLPKKEIMAYIEKMKDFNDNKFSIGMSRKTIINDDVMKYDNVTYKSKGKSATVQERWAESFYIYDCYKILKLSNKSDEIIYAEIDLELIKYHNLNDKKDYYSVDTYKKSIMKDMKHFIDELGYKKLLIGHDSLG
ncbi:MAG: hypothetical protein C0627_06985 [Sulfurimonas sp.]|nr:MAG: hypothetical protein C0627_06985 [Sulfurimonas sp.]